MNEITFTIPFRLPSLNEVIEKNRANRYMGAKLKRETEDPIVWLINSKRVPTITEYPVVIEIEWHEASRKRDVDNIQSSQKFVLDAMVRSGMLHNDSRRYVSQVHHTVIDDKEDKVVVIIRDA